MKIAQRLALLARINPPEFFLASNIEPLAVVVLSLFTIDLITILNV